MSTPILGSRAYADGTIEVEIGVTPHGEPDIVVLTLLDIQDALRFIARCKSDRAHMSKLDRAYMSEIGVVLECDLIDWRSQILDAQVRNQATLNAYRARGAS